MSGREAFGAAPRGSGSLYTIRSAVVLPHLAMFADADAGVVVLAQGLFDGGFGIVLIGLKLAPLAADIWPFQSRSISLMRSDGRLIKRPCRRFPAAPSTVLAMPSRWSRR